MNPDNQIEENSEIPLCNQSDANLVRAWQSGSQQAASALMDRYAARLVALISVRLSKPIRQSVDPEDIVQSAMGSFFNAARHNKIQVSQSVFVWDLLAVIARRKLTRVVEKSFAEKRGGNFRRVSLEINQEIMQTASDSSDDIAATILEDLPSELGQIAMLLWSGYSQTEIACELNISDRTVRRRIEKIRDAVAPVDTTLSSQQSESKPPMLQRYSYGEFVLAKMIGSGGFGKVYRAVLRETQAVVAIKFLRRQFWQDVEAKNSFLAEIASASQVCSPNVIRYFGWGESPHGGPFVISQWIDGVPLDRMGNLSKEKFVDLLQQLCTTLRLVHDAGIVHGDVTPRNFIVEKSGRLVLTDFGFARSNLGEPIATERLGGTLGFAAPEQVSHAFGEISPATDIYAIGGIVHWYLTGAAPNAATSIQESVASTLDDGQRKVTTENKHLQEIVSATLQASPASRSSLANLIAILKRVD